MKTNLQGFIPSLSIREYHEHPAVGSTTLARARRSWAHAKAPFEETDATIFGSSFHTLALEPELFSKLYVKCPEGMRRDERHKGYQEFLAANPGKTVLKAEEYDALDGMLGAILNHNLALGLLRNGIPEQSVFWKDADTGVLCKCRPDFLRDNDVIVDIKTAADASLDAFQATLLKYGRHIQTAFYLDGLSAVTGRKFTNFVHLVIEKTAPYGVGVYSLDDESIEQGRREYKSLLKTYSFCQKIDHFPSYPEVVQTVSIPFRGFTYE